MAEQREDEVELSAEEIIKSFLEATKDVPSEVETYYSHEMYNVLRSDGEPSTAEARADFRRRFLKIAPSVDEDGNIRVEVARWTR
ncbi:MAG: hypothetical protein NZ934_02615 [Hadesarchaea archaeon]|nr:hypothetical protein [Hadesarchaea archaeon]